MTVSCNHAWCHKTDEIEEGVRLLKSMRLGSKEWAEQRAKIDKLVAERAQIAQTEEMLDAVQEALAEEGINVCRVTLEEKPN